MSYAGKHVSSRRSATVKSIEIALWFGALLAVASIFVFGGSRSAVDTLFANNSDLLALAIGEQITDPTFTGVTNTDDAFTIGASSAVPDRPSPTRVTLHNPTTSVELASGIYVFARAERGAFDVEERFVSMNGEAIITSSNGYRIDSDTIRLDVRNAGLTAEDGVLVRTPQGEITAGALSVTSAEDEGSDTNFVLVFENDVKMTLYGVQGE